MSISEVKVGRLKGLEISNFVPVAAASVPDAPTGQYNYFVDIADNELKKKDDAGNVTLIGGAGAATDLSNLTPTAINESLVPDTVNTYSVGSQTLYWATVWADTVRANFIKNIDETTDGLEAIELQTGLIKDNNGDVAINWNNGQLFQGVQEKANWQTGVLTDAAGNQSISWEGRELSDAAGVSAVDYANRTLDDATGAPVLAWSATQVDVNNVPIVNVANPTNAQDAATKAYVDGLVGVSCFTKVTYAYTDFSDAGTTKTLVLKTLVAKEFVKSAYLVLTTSFLGAGGTCTVSVSTPSFGKVTSGLELLQIASGTTFLAAQLVGIGNFAAGENLEITVESDAPLNLLTAGNMEVYYCTEVLPA